MAFGVQKAKTIAARFAPDKFQIFIKEWKL